MSEGNEEIFFKENRDDEEILALPGEKPDAAPNFYALRTFLPFHQDYLYVDAKGRFSRDIFDSYGLPVKILKTYCRRQDDFEIVICRIPRKSAGLFSVCMKRVREEAYCYQYQGYDDFCQRFYNDYIAGKER